MKTYLVTVFLFFQLLSLNVQALISQTNISDTIASKKIIQKKISSKNTTQVLLINSLNQDSPWQQSVERGLRSELLERNAGFDLFIENMDVGRFNEMRQKRLMKAYLQQKYYDKRIDIIISRGVPAASLLSEFDTLFTGIPIIYLTPGGKFKVPKNENGIIIRPKLNYKQGVINAVNLTNPKKLIVILDRKSGIGSNFYQHLMPIINRDFSHLKLEKWFDLPADELINKVNNAPADSIILFTPIFRRYNDTVLSPFKFVERLTSNSSVPIFSYWHSLLGSGIVGGYLLSGEKIGARIAESIVFFDKNKYLEPVDSDQLSTYYYDFKQLKKFEIAPQNLPEHSIIINNLPSYFEQNKMLIYSAIAVITILSGFLAFVLLLNSKRVQLLKELDSEKLKLEYRVEQRTEELLIAKNEAEHSASIKSDFLANMSHEIRTPMNGVIGLTNILLDSNLPPEQKQYLDKIKYSSDQLLIVINDILDFSKIESGNINLEEFPFSVNSVVDYIKATFDELAQSKGIKFDIVIDKEVKLDLIGDVVRINQVLLNLCSNAIKFTTHGFVSVSIESKRSLADPKSVCLYFIVKDTGIGIAEQNLVDLFESFTQADSSTTRKFGGTGLGLTISKRLCQSMGGDITVKSTQGVGSEFIASIKVKLNNKVLIEDTPGLTFTDPFEVLIIDDNKDDLEVIGSQLSAMGLVCTSCCSVKQAIDIIEQNKEKFKAIIVDWAMPVMSCETFLIRIHSISPQLYSKIIVLTMSDESLINDAGKKVSIQTILHKPVYTSVLYEAIERKVVGSINKAPVANIVSEKSLAGIKILVVEDNSINRIIATNILENAGAQIHLVGNGLECIQIVKSEAFDIILMDIHMPIMDGVEASQIIRSDNDETIANIPIIALTANVMKDDITRYLSIGMNAHVAKPIKAQKLRETIILCLSK